MRMKVSRVRDRILFCILLLVALLLRVGFVVARFDELSIDRDLYLAPSQAVWNGLGIINPASNEPTAFRPPLYILIVAVCRGLGGFVGLAAYQCFIGVVTVWLTFRISRLLSLGRGAWIAGLFVAFDPILIRYTALPMTEVTFTAILAWTVFLWSKEPRTTFRVVMLGIVFGLSALCRPTPWPLLLVLPTLAFLLQFASRWRKSFGSNIDTRQILRHTIIIGLIAFCTALPWGLRNYFLMGQFKLTTTHGGYTLLLGNNETFFEAVLNQPLGVTWGDYTPEDPLSQPRWARRVNKKLNELGAKTEFERDRAQYQMAFQEIREQPWSFVRACGLRQLRFWSPIPVGPEANSYPTALLLGLWVFYGALYLFAITGIVQILTSGADKTRWLWSFALIITIATVHCFYWSNARMRAPLIPSLALLAAVPFRGKNE